jgi:hypothetical protein
MMIISFKIFRHKESAGTVVRCWDCSKFKKRCYVCALRRRGAVVSVSANGKEDSGIEYRQGVRFFEEFM